MADVNRGGHHEQPAVIVLANERVSAEHLAQVRYGIEEEGIPFRVRTEHTLDPFALAHRAAVESRLGVGIGLGLDDAVITTDKLPERRPYIVTPLGASRESDRAVGACGARIVKRQPLAVPTANA